VVANHVLSQLSYVPVFGGPGPIRTADLVLIRDAL
jgi:hypothetical protein